MADDEAFFIANTPADPATQATQCSILSKKWKKFLINKLRLDK